MSEKSVSLAPSRFAVVLAAFAAIRAVDPDREIPRVVDLYVEYLGEEVEVSPGFHVMPGVPELLEELSRIRPDDPDVWRELGRIYADKSMDEQSRRALEQARTLQVELNKIYE